MPGTGLRPKAYFVTMQCFELQQSKSLKASANSILLIKRAEKIIKIHQLSWCTIYLQFQEVCAKLVWVFLFIFYRLCFNFCCLQASFIQRSQLLNGKPLLNHRTIRWFSNTIKKTIILTVFVGGTETTPKEQPSMLDKS